MARSPQSFLNFGNPSKTRSTEPTKPFVHHVYGGEFHRTVGAVPDQVMKGRRRNATPFPKTNRIEASTRHSASRRRQHSPAGNRSHGRRLRRPRPDFIPLNGKKRLLRKGTQFSRFMSITPQKGSPLRKTPSFPHPMQNKHQTIRREINQSLQRTTRPLPRTHHRRTTFLEPAV